MKPISTVATELGLSVDEIIPFGRDKAKLPLSVFDQPGHNGKLILVSAITPTPAGEGKTTTTIGLVQALYAQGESVCAALREPSLGPCFGVKGGGTGGGASRIEPSTSINLHFTGDLHAITAAHNLIAAMLDNHLHFRSSPEIDPRRVVWRRVLDQNDRALRNVNLGLGGRTQGVPRESGFDITAASEVMAMLCLANDLDDLRARIGRAIVGHGYDGAAVTVDDIGATGAALALLQDAILPNLVQTTEGAPAIVHGGPFANIAHGCNSVIATRMALHLADWCVTEAGFGFDLGAEKFFDIKCRIAEVDPAAVVLVATVRALKMHGEVSLDDLTKPDPEAVRRGLPNLEKHLESIAAFGKPAVVALNRFGADTDEEIAVVREACERLGASFALSDHFERGGQGALALADAVKIAASGPLTPFRPMYALEQPIVEKIRAVAQTIYGARSVNVHPDAMAAIARIRKLGYANLPICIAKTQSSLSDDPRLRGRPQGFELNVRQIQLSAGAGFLVVLTGDIVRMPGLPRRPQACDVDIVDGVIVGVQ